MKPIKRNQTAQKHIEQLITNELLSSRYLFDDIAIDALFNYDKNEVAVTVTEKVWRSNSKKKANLEEWLDINAHNHNFSYRIEGRTYYLPYDYLYRISDCDCMIDLCAIVADDNFEVTIRTKDFKEVKVVVKWSELEYRKIRVNYHRDETTDEGHFLYSDKYKNYIYFNSRNGVFEIDSRSILANRSRLTHAELLPLIRSEKIKGVLADE